MEKGTFYGKMAEDMMGSTSMAKKMDLENFGGVMVGSIKDSGKMENRMAEVSLSLKMAKKRLEFGVMVKIFGGSTDRRRSFNMMIIGNKEYFISFMDSSHRSDT